VLQHRWRRCYRGPVQVDAVIVAAGASTRFGDHDKLLADLCGAPVIAWSLAAYEAAEGIERIVLVVAPERREALTEIGRTWAPGKLAAVVDGGARRRDSVEAGLRACSNRYVAIHDGARPLTTAPLIARCIEAAKGRPGAIAAVPVTDTIKEGRDGVITGHPYRSRLWAAQTPQVVLRQAWLDAAAASDDDETDDAAMLARYGLEVALAEGDPGNIKITRPLDLAFAAAILRTRGVTPCG
jgi:2-C-methyl-D-erythritol 4-phosphate cytidylyltransferase